MRAFCLLLAAGAATVMPVTEARRTPDAHQRPVDVALRTGNVPLVFEDHTGQSGSRLQFISRNRNAVLQLTGAEAVLGIRALKNSGPATLRSRFVGANPNARPIGKKRLPSVSNYLIGNDPKKWHLHLPNYGRVKQENVYPGIDVIYYGNETNLEYDIIVAAGADPRIIREEFSGCQSERIESSTGDLVLQVGQVEVREKRPIAYQEEAGKRTPVQVEWGLATSSEHLTTASFRLGAFDPRRPLIIDPALAYSTYLGGSANDTGRAICVDDAGCAYITGGTFSTDFPTLAPYQSQPGDASNNVFVTKLSPDGSALVYSTYLGGNGWDEGAGIRVDASGSAYVAGTTSSTDFPTANAYQTDPGDSDDDAFVAKLSPAGDALVYSTYLGGNGTDQANALAIDVTGRAYVTGSTFSTNFPTVNPLQGSLSTSSDAFVTRVSSTGSTLDYSTYLGGTATDEGNGIDVDDHSCAYVTGRTGSSDFPKLSGALPMHAFFEAFVTKLTSQGNALVYTAFLGGASDDQGSGIAVDKEGNAYVVGTTDSDDFPLANALQSQKGSFEDTFVSKISRDGRSLHFSTYLGGNSDDAGAAIDLDTDGNAYVVGEAASTDLPADDFPGDGMDAFVAKFSTTGNLRYLYYLGGTFDDHGKGVAVDENGSVFLTGSTNSGDLPVWNAYQSSLGGQTSGFVARFVPYLSPTGLSAGSSSTVINVTWSNHSADADGIEIQRHGLGGTFVTIGYADPRAVSFLDDNLNPGTLFYYRVRAYGREGRSEWSPTLVTVTLPDNPNAPTGLYATANAANQLLLRWTDNANNEDGFHLERSTNRTSWTSLPDGTSNTVQFTDTGLTAGATYYYRINAYNSAGTSAWSEVATGVVLPTAPAAPTSLRVATVNQTQVLLGWRDRSNNESGFKIERKLVGGTFAQVGTALMNANSFMDSDLTPATKYIYRVRATNAGGDSGYSNEEGGSTFPLPPAAPSNLTATPLSNRVVALAWTDNSNNETEFRVERKQGTAAYAQIAVVAANGTSYFDSAVAPSTTYTYRVRAANAGGTSAYTTQVNGVTPAGSTDGVLQVRPTAIRFHGVKPGESATEKLLIANAGKGNLKVVVAQLAPPFTVIGTRTFTLKKKEQRTLLVRYDATATSKGATTTLGIAGSGRKNPLVYVPVTAD